MLIPGIFRHSPARTAGVTRFLRMIRSGLIIGLSSISFQSRVCAAENYEPNNTLADARPILVNEPPQTHKFDYLGDEDWLVFYARKGTPYDIQIVSESVGQGVNPALELFNEAGEIEVGLFDFNFTGDGELLAWDAPANGFYYIRVSNRETDFSADGHYAIKVFLPLAPQNGLVKGRVIDRCAQKGIAKALVMTHVDQTFSHSNGEYGIPLDPGTYAVSSYSQGYQEKTSSAVVAEVTVTPLEFELMPEVGCSPNNDTTHEPGELELERLKAQSVAVYDETSGLLTIKDVRVGNEILTASLQAQADFSFKLISTTSLNNAVFNSPAFYDHDTLLADIPQVFAFDRLYSVRLKKISDDWVYRIEQAEPL